jgi:cyclophilin family peptidyl-prolyl cis-trans isomerase
MRRFVIACVLVAGLAGAVSAAPAQVVFEIEDLGSFTVRLLDSTPLHRDNFLYYVENALYDGSIVNRSDSTNRVIQGGGFALNSDPAYLLTTVPVNGTVAYEGDLGGSNVKYSLGMARTTDPDSGTNQWYINMGDNSPWFDHDVGTGDPGYTVFGNVIAGFDVVDAIYAQTVWNAGMYFSTDGVNPNGNFANLPLMDSFDNTGPIEKTDFVVVTRATVAPEPATLALVAAGGLALWRRRSRR